jgi:hypothetical protein
MPPKSETRAGARASRNSFRGCFRDLSSPLDLQTQLLVVAYHVRPEVAAMIATLAFGGGV